MLAHLFHPVEMLCARLSPADSEHFVSHCLLSLKSLSKKRILNLDVLLRIFSRYEVWSLWIFREIIFERDLIDLMKFFVCVNFWIDRQSSWYILMMVSYSASFHERLGSGPAKHKGFQNSKQEAYVFDFYVYVDDRWYIQIFSIYNHVSNNWQFSQNSVIGATSHYPSVKEKISFLQYS